MGMGVVAHALGRRNLRENNIDGPEVGEISQKDKSIITYV